MLMHIPGFTFTALRLCVWVLPYYVAQQPTLTATSSTDCKSEISSIYPAKQIRTVH